VGREATVFEVIYYLAKAFTTICILTFDILKTQHQRGRQQNSNCGRTVQNSTSK
jgi:hypothetical protein